MTDPSHTALAAAQSAAASASSAATSAAHAANIIAEPVDGSVAALVADSGSDTATALSATFGRGIVVAAKADYTGRVGTSGTGTDNRAAIQAALNAASDLVSSSDYYTPTLTRRSITVKLPAGVYLIGANGTNPSLTVPVGVTFDTSEAELYFDLPTTATNDWCAIAVKNYGNLIVGRLTNSGRVAAPDTRSMYDGVRLVHTDNNSHVIGSPLGEISGFPGACIRGIAAWISHVSDLRLQGRYGYLASNKGDAFGSFYAWAGPTGGTSRVHTEVSFKRVQFVNGYSGFRGVALGTNADPNGPDMSASGLTTSFDACSFENLGGYAADISNAFNVTFRDCHFEEVGNGDGMVNLNTVRSVIVDNLMINLAGGRDVPAPGGGTVQPFPTAVFKCASVQYLGSDGTYLHNTFQPTLAYFGGSAPSQYDVRGVFTDANALAASATSPVRSDRRRYTSGTDFKGVKATRATNANVLTSTWTPVPLDGEAWDTDVFHDPATNNSRITIPTGHAGRYRFAGVFPFASNTTGKRVARIYKNGATLVDRVELPANTNGATIMRLSVDDAAVAGDYYELMVWADHGVASPGLASDVTAAPIYFSAQRLD